MRRVTYLHNENRMQMSMRACMRQLLFPHHPSDTNELGTL